MKVGCVVALCCMLAASPAAAQDTTAVPAAAAAVDTGSPTPPAPTRATDSVPTMHPPISPMGAFWRSLLVPGWGQARLGRRTAAAFFIAAEGVTLGMTLTTSSQLNYLEATNSGSVESKSQQREDWLVLLGLNHLLAAMEAYVSAHLWDFPGDLSIQSTPNGMAGALSVPVRFP